MGPASDPGNGLHESTTANVGGKGTAEHTPNVAKHIANTNVTRT